MDLVMIALNGKGKSFDKVLTMIDKMVSLLGKEQDDDDTKKSYCEASVDKAEDEKKALDRTAEDLATSIADAKEEVASLGEDTKELQAGIAKLDKSVAEATE